MVNEIGGFSPISSQANFTARKHDAINPEITPPLTNLNPSFAGLKPSTQVEQVKNNDAEAMTLSHMFQHLWVKMQGGGGSGTLATSVDSTINHKNGINFLA